MHKLTIPMLILSSFLSQPVSWAQTGNPMSKKVDSSAKGTAEQAKKTAEEAKKTADEAKKDVEETKKDVKETKEDVKETKKDVEETKKAVIGQRGERDFAGLHFGAGVGFTRTFGRDRIKSATNDNGIVRIDGEQNALPRAMLESHFFLTPRQWGELFDHWDYSADEKGHFGLGPYVGIVPGSSEIIQAIALGIMFGFKDPVFKNAGHSWNLGVGVSLEPNAVTLGDGLEPNQPVPPGATVRTQTRSLAGVTAVLSYGW
jgi:hypothetical protein